KHSLLGSVAQTPQRSAKRSVDPGEGRARYGRYLPTCPRLLRARGSINQRGCRSQPATDGVILGAGPRPRSCWRTWMALWIVKDPPSGDAERYMLENSVVAVGWSRLS